MNTSEYITIGGITLTFIVGIINLINTSGMHKKTNFINAVTAERVKWIGALRELISDYLSITTIFESKTIYKGEERNKFIEELIRLKGAIKLHLNASPDSRKDMEINRLIEKINTKYLFLYEVVDVLEQVKVDGLTKAHLEQIEMKKKQDMIFHLMLKQLYNDHKGVDLLNELLEDNLADEHSNDLSKYFIKSLNNVIKWELGYRGRTEFLKLTDELTEKSSNYLKVEWEKVKAEAEMGNLNTYKPLKKRLFTFCNNIIKWTKGEL